MFAIAKAAAGDRERAPPVSRWLPWLWAVFAAAKAAPADARPRPGSVGDGLKVTPGGAWRRFTPGRRTLPLLGAAFQSAGDEGSVGVHPTRCRRHAPPAEPVSSQPTEAGPWRRKPLMDRVGRRAERQSGGDTVAEIIAVYNWGGARRSQPHPPSRNRRPRDGDGRRHHLRWEMRRHAAKLTAERETSAPRPADPADPDRRPSAQTVEYPLQLLG